MDPSSLLILVGAGFAAGFIAGLVGVGGGVIFAPVLFFYYQGVGIDDSVIAPLTIGTSLLCTLIAALVSARAQYRRGAVSSTIALQVGLYSALAIFLMTRFVTTQSWYDGTAFQIVFSGVLLIVVVRMLFRSEDASPGDSNAKPASEPGSRARGRLSLAAMGTAAGSVASAAGVGGGIVLVPAYHHILGMRMISSTATSSATIVIISLVGVLNYIWMGWNVDVPRPALGYVDWMRALLLAAPAVVTANLGVRVAHRINRRALQLSFAAIAAFVAVRLLWNAVG